MWWLIAGLVLTIIIVECSDAVLDAVNKRVVSNYDAPWVERMRIVKRNTFWTWLVMMSILFLLWVCIAERAVRLLSCLHVVV